MYVLILWREGSSKDVRLGNNIGRERLRLRLRLRGFSPFSVRRASPKPSAVKLVPHLFLQSECLVVTIGLRRVEAFDVKRVVRAHGEYPRPVNVLAAPARAVAARGFQQPLLRNLPVPPLPQHSPAQGRRHLVDCQYQEIRHAAGDAAAHRYALRRRAPDDLSHARRQLRWPPLQQGLTAVRCPEHHPVGHGRKIETLRKNGMWVLGLEPVAGSCWILNSVERMVKMEESVRA